MTERKRRIGQFVDPGGVKALRPSAERSEETTGADRDVVVDEIRQFRVLKVRLEFAALRLEFDLAFEAPTDLNNNKSIGGRVGFLPIPALEIGYSNLFARVDPDGSDVGNVDAELQSVDLAYARDVAPLKGALKFRSQWAWSSVDDATYDSTGALGFGPLQVNNNMSSGGYAQVAYRPSQVQSETLKKFEFVVRYDDLELPSSAPRNIDERRWTFGVDYWVNSSTVFKLAYQLDDTNDPAGIEGDRDAVLFQAAMGF